MRNEIRYDTQARQPQPQLESTRQKSQYESQLHKLRRTRCSKTADRGENHQRNSRGRPRDQVPGRAKQGRDNGYDNSRIEPINRGHTGNHGESHALRQHDNSPRQSGDEVVFQRPAAYHWPPCQEREELLDDSLFCICHDMLFFQKRRTWPSPKGRPGSKNNLFTVLVQISGGLSCFRSQTALCRTLKLHHLI